MIPVTVVQQNMICMIYIHYSNSKFTVEHRVKENYIWHLKFVYITGFKLEKVSFTLKIKIL